MPPFTKEIRVNIRQTVEDLPDSMMMAIGTVLVRWAAYEMSVQLQVIDAAGIDRQLGAIAIREPRVSDRLDMLGQVLRLKSIPYPSETLTKLRVVTEELVNFRDQIAHGVWFATADSAVFELTETSGSWTKELKAPSARKKVFPGLSKLSAPVITEKAAQIRSLAVEFLTFCQPLGLNELPLPIQTLQYQPQTPSGGRNPKKPLSPPKS